MLYTYGPARVVTLALANVECGDSWAECTQWLRYVKAGNQPIADGIASGIVADAFALRDARRNFRNFEHTVSVVQATVAAYEYRRIVRERGAEWYV